MKLYSINSYKSPETKEIVRKAKNLDNQALSAIAHNFYMVIQNIIKIYTTHAGNHKPNNKNKLNILLLHSPSSSFCRKQKNSDHMSEAISHIVEINIFDKNKPKFNLFGHNHAFIIKIDKISSQHNKSRKERIIESKNRFKIVSPYLNQIKYSTHDNLIPKFDYIFILDDVLTTGSTLYHLSNLLERHIGIDESIASYKPGRVDRVDRENSKPQVICLAYCH